MQLLSWPVQVVADYNADERVHGVLVQLPLPKHISEKEVLDAVSLDKDVDGFHPHNIGSLALRGRSPKFVSCTPKVRLSLMHASSSTCEANGSGVLLFDKAASLMLQP